MEVIRYYCWETRQRCVKKKRRREKKRIEKGRRLAKIEAVISSPDYSTFSMWPGWNTIRYSVLWKTASVDRTATYRPGQKNCSLFPAKTLKACKIKIHRRTGGYSISPLWHAIFALHPRVDVAFHPGISSLTCPRDQTTNVVLITQKYQPYQTFNRFVSPINDTNQDKFAFSQFFAPNFIPLLPKRKKTVGKQAILTSSSLFCPWIFTRNKNETKRGKKKEKNK